MIEEEKKVKEEVIEIIEVYGMCLSLRSVIDRKKEVGIVIDFIVVEDISEFLDKNIGEVL